MSAEGTTQGARRGLAGRVLGGRYRVVRMVSAGASVLIADAEDTELERAVTVKLVRPEIAESPEFRRKFVATMRAMTKLSHPNIAAVHDWGEERIGKRTTVYAVVEHLAGGSLRDLFDRGRRLDPSQALMVGLEACRALDFAHRKHLVHGELTPSKLVFGDDRRLRVVDFGLARLLGANDWREPSTLPTHVARYASPEQALGQPIDDKSDVYSLALVLVEAVSGTVPFAARSTVATLSARVGRLMPVSADLGPLAAVLERAGRPDPADRSTAAELGRGLVRAAEKLPRPAPIPIVVSSLFEDDPSQLRRPNDPTGGVRRPAPEPVVPLVPPAPSGDEEQVAEPASEPDEAPRPEPAGDAVVPTDPPEPTVTASPEEHAAGVSMGAAAVAGSAAAAAAAAAVTTAAGAGHDVSDLLDTTDEEAPAEPAEPAADEPVAGAVGTIEEPPSGPPLLPPPAVPAEPEPAPSDADHVPDGDAAELRTELAALAQPPAEPVVAPAEAAAPAEPVETVETVAEPAEPDVGVAPGPPVVAPPAESSRRRRRWVPWVIAVAVIAALGALGLLAYNLFKVPTHPVPDLVGLEEAAAREQTADFNWDIEIRRERSDEHPDPGEIIRTAPSAGADLAEDEPFLIVVSEGPEFRALAELSGMTLSEAETQLAEQRLVALPPIEEHHEDVPAGSVISWSVPGDATLGAGGQVLPGTEVQVVVSAGPAPRTIPELVGLTVEEATAALEELKLGVTVADAMFSDDIAKGAVVSVDPPEGTTDVERGTAVTITPSKGVDLVTMPTVEGLTLAQARDALTKAGLRVGSLLGNTQGTVVEARVGGEIVEAGEQFKRGSTVALALF
jgi:serine/threonine-protein kinase